MTLQHICKQHSGFGRWLVLISLSLAMSDSYAALQSRANGTMVYDTVQNITWVADANLFKTLAFASGDDVAYVQNFVSANPGLSVSNFNTSFGRMSWQAAKTWAAQLVYGGFSDWRLPITNPEVSGLNISSSEFGHLFYVDLNGVAGSPIPDTSFFINEQRHFYWSDTEFSAGPSDAWGFNTNNGEQRANSQTGLQGVWLVRDGDVAPVPLPSAAWFMLSGLLTSLGMRRRWGA